MGPARFEWMNPNEEVLSPFGRRNQKGKDKRGITVNYRVIRKKEIKRGPRGHPPPPEF